MNPEREMGFLKPTCKQKVLGLHVPLAFRQSNSTQCFTIYRHSVNAKDNQLLMLLDQQGLLTFVMLLHAI